MLSKSTYGTMYYVDDMAKAVSFYKKTFGLTPGYESPEWTEFPVGGHSICLHHKQPNEKYTPNGILILKVDGLKSLYEKMKADGLNVFGLHEIHPGAWTFHIKDPNQNELSFHGAP